MIPHIPVGADIRDQIYSYLENDVVFMSYLGGDPLRVLPRPDADVQSAARPFVWIHHEGTGSLGDDDINLGTWAVEVHDLPDNLFWTVDRALERLEELFDGAWWERPTISRHRAFRSWWLSESGELTDQGFGTRKKIGRFVMTVT
jgi:hypothetical protein